MTVYLVGRVPGNVRATENNFPGARGNEAADGVQRGRFTATVGAENSHHFALGNAVVYAAKHLFGPVGHMQAVDAQKRFMRAQGRPPILRGSV